jgi:hypothetical protein
MALTTCNVTGAFVLPTSIAHLNAVAVFTLSAPDTDGEVLIPREVRSPLGAGGELEVDLWPNARGSGNTVYRLRVDLAADANAGRVVQAVDYGTVFVPDIASVGIDDLLESPVPVPMDSDTLAAQYALLSRAWAESAIAPGDPGTKSAKTWAGIASDGAAQTRADVVVRIAGGWVPTNGIQYLIGGQIYKGATGATYIADLPGLVPVNPTPEHHGCAGDWNPATQTGTDDQTRFVEFLTYLAATNEKGKLGAKKNYRLTAPIVIAQFDLTLEGAGPNQSILTLDHTSKIGIQNRRSGCTFQNFKLEASDARRAGAGKTSIGFLLSDISGSGSGAFAKVEHVHASGHPGHGIINGAAAANFTQCITWDNGGHGLAHDASGVYTGIVVSGYPGWSRYTLCRASGNGGHGFCIGHPDDGVGSIPYRIQMNNCEAYANATDAAVRHDTSQIYVMAVGGTLSECNAECGAGSGMTLSGAYLRIINARFTDPSGGAPVVKIKDGTTYPTRDILIDTMYVNGGTVAVAVDISGVASPETKQLRIVQHNTTNITAAASDPSKFAVYQFGLTHKTLSKLYAPNLYAGGFEVGPISDFASFTPTLTTVAAGDFSVVFSASNECLYRRLGKYAYMKLRLVFTPTFTTGGVLLIGNLPFALENTRNARDNLPVSQFEKIKTGTMTQLTVQRNNSTTLRVIGSGPNADAVTLTAVDHLTSGQQSVILAEGWVEVG